VSFHTVTLGSGSGEILTNAVRAFTSPSKPYVAANPTWESPGATARKIGTSVRLVDLDENLRVDLEKLADAAQGAGLVYFCNPNNPTATVHGAGIVDDFVKQVHSASPDTVVVIDEAYHDYVTEPSYRTAAEIAKTTPRVIVTRSMSKAYGMAGMRVGYAVGDRQIISALARFRMPYGINLPAIAAASVALANQAHIDAERKRNAEVRAFTLRAFEQLGFKASASETNFIFVELDRSAKTFRAACARHGVIVGRDFPPLEGTHCRISLGTMSEMQKAVAIFKKVLGSMAAPTKL
jgi:histidinol-phosphate aminotransferase